MENLILSCDWGTSFFRLKLVDTGSRKIIDEVTSPQGNAVIYKKWMVQAAADRLPFYLQYLKEQVDALAARTGLPLYGTTVVISGMASSSIGIKELPYARLPFSTDGSDVQAQWLSGQPVMQNRILLISGAGSAQDVMRGEETQLVGNAGLFDDGKQIIRSIFPGTHSKHILVRNKAAFHIETYMTGEVFALMSGHSILRQSIALPQDTRLHKDKSDAFRSGVEKSFRSNLLHSLFSVRVNQIWNYFSKEQNYYYLSGLLIGTELSSIQEEDKSRIVLCGGNKLHDLYRLALQYSGLIHRSAMVPAEDMDNAAVEGQIKILEKKRF